MTHKDYFRHIRSLGPFRAIEAIALARQAAELDAIAAQKRAPLPAVVWYELLPDGSEPIKFSRGITVY